MSLIIAGRFNTFADAEAAANTLFGKGFLEEDVTLFFVNPRGQHHRFPIGGDVNADAGSANASKGAGAGVAIGAVIGAIVGVLIVSFFHTFLAVTILAAGVGAYVGSLAGAMKRTRQSGPPQTTRARDDTGTKEIRETGVLLAIHVNEENKAIAADVLREAGAHDVERASGRWAQGKWTDFDPLEPPHLAGDIGRERQEHPASAAI
ncbi:MAG: hypothetical protein ACRYG5_06125 [Janthinobacterium lividum]